MTASMRLTLAVLAGALTAAAVLAQDEPPPPAAGRGRGGRGGAAGAGAAGGRRGPSFPQQTRTLAPPEVIARGKAVYGVNCAACHGADLRGGDQGGPSLLRSLVALSDQHGEVIAPIVHGSRQDKGMPGFNLSDADVTATAEYIHSVLAMVGSQARPPGAADPSKLNVLTGSASAGQALFRCEVRRVSFGDRRPEGHCRQIRRSADAAKYLGLGRWWGRPPGRRTDQADSRHRDARQRAEARRNACPQGRLHRDAHASGRHAQIDRARRRRAQGGSARSRRSAQEAGARRSTTKRCTT